MHSYTNIDSIQSMEVRERLLSCTCADVRPDCASLLEHAEGTAFESKCRSASAHAMNLADVGPHSTQQIQTMPKEQERVGHVKLY
eukprot:SAG31_NODE_597_length_13674_cov_3.402947_6_plen_85_part_00